MNSGRESLLPPEAEVQRRDRTAIQRSSALSP